MEKSKKRRNLLENYYVDMPMIGRHDDSFLDRYTGTGTWSNDDADISSEDDCFDIVEAEPLRYMVSSAIDTDSMCQNATGFLR